MKFIHMADVHLGSWRDPKMRELSTRAFVGVISRALSERVDFVLMAGDLFNTSLPPIETLKIAVTQLKRLKDADIPVYTIAGSHDFSPSGKTMLEVLEEADLVKNVCRGRSVEGKLELNLTVDPKTGAKITGMIGKKGMLERSHYEGLITKNLEQETGFKIFMFHTALTELKPEELAKMEAAPISLLPRGFDYYAGGHVHIVKEASIEGYKKVVYPGPTFPNSFSELEKLGCGGYYSYDGALDDGKIAYHKIDLAPVVTLSIDCSNKTPQQGTELLLDEVMAKTVKDSIVLIRLYGQLDSGNTSDIDLGLAIERIHEKGAYSVMKNTSKLSSNEFEEIKVSADSAEEAERSVIEEHVGQIRSLELDAQEEKALVETLMTLLDTEKDEGEKVSDYERRVLVDIQNVFEK
ncbi:MAG: exonuclease SbcCD subunit D [Candidatus Woesearchaeota archaeon]